MLQPYLVQMDPDPGGPKHRNPTDPDPQTAFKLFFFQSFLKGETQIPSDEAFQNAVHSYNEIFLKAGRSFNHGTHSFMALIHSWHSFIHDTHSFMALIIHPSLSLNTYTAQLIITMFFYTCIRRHCGV